MREQVRVQVAEQVREQVASGRARESRSRAQSSFVRAVISGIGRPNPCISVGGTCSNLDLGGSRREHGRPPEVAAAVACHAQLHARHSAAVRCRRDSAAQAQGAGVQGLLPVQAAEGQMRPDSALQDVCCPRAPRALLLPPTQRGASPRETGKHGHGARHRPRLQQRPSAHTRRHGHAAARGAHTCGVPEIRRADHGRTGSASATSCSRPRSRSAS